MKKVKDNLREFLQVKNQTETTADLYFYGDIVSDWWGAWSDEDQYPDSVKNFLSEHKDKKLNIYINSGGGSVFAGLAIYNMLKRHNGEKTVYVDGLAASIASIIALAGDKVIMPRSSMMMVHKPWSWCSGNALDFSKMASDLEEIEKCILSVYQDNLKDGVEMQSIIDMVNAETWLTGEEAEKYFNIDIGEEKQISACVSDLFKDYSRTPKMFLQMKEETKNEELNNQEKERLYMLLGLM